MTDRANSTKRNGTAKTGGACLPVSIGILLLTILWAMGPSIVFSFGFAMATFVVSFATTMTAYCLVEFPDAPRATRPTLWVAATYTTFLGSVALFYVWGGIFDNGMVGSVPLFTDALSGVAVVVASMIVGLCLLRHYTDGNGWTSPRIAKAVAAAIWSAVFATVMLLAISRMISGPPGGL